MDSDRSVPDQARLAFLEEGANSYLDALLAIAEFQREVRVRCKDALERHLSDYGRALDVKLEPESIDDWPPAGKELWGTGVWTSLGARLRHPPGGIYTSYCILHWMRESEGLWFGVWQGMGFSRNTDCMEVCKVFKALQPATCPAIKVDCENKHVGLSLNLSPADMTSLDEKLDEVLSAWIQLWQQFGGFKALAAAQA